MVLLHRYAIAWYAISLGPCQALTTTLESLSCSTRQSHGNQTLLEYVHVVLGDIMCVVSEFEHRFYSVRVLVQYVALVTNAIPEV